MMDNWLVVTLAILAYILATMGALRSMATDESISIALIIMWIFGGLALFLTQDNQTIATIMGVTSFLIALLGGFIALNKQKSSGIIVTISFLVAALFLLRHITGPLVFLP